MKTLTLALLTISAALAQKKATFQLTHPPLLGQSLSGRSVTIQSVSGPCANEFSTRLTSDLAAHRVQIVHRAEPGVVTLTIEIARCEAHRREALRGAGLPAPHISRVEGRFQATIRATDLGAPKEQTIRAEAHKENESQTSPPEYPAQSEVLEILIAKAVAEAQHLYFPWKESREIPFLDDKECDLRQAYELVKAGNFDQALRLSRETVDSCKSGPKTMAGAWYNLGVLLMAGQKYEDALHALDESQKLNNRRFVAEVAADCRRDKELVDAAKPPPAPPTAEPSEPVQTGMLMTNELVIKLTDANVAEEEIVKMIAGQPARFDLSSAAVQKLKQAGVTDRVVAAMREKVTRGK